MSNDGFKAEFKEAGLTQILVFNGIQADPEKIKNRDPYRQ